MREVYFDAIEENRTFLIVLLIEKIRVLGTLLEWNFWAEVHNILDWLR